MPIFKDTYTHTIRGDLLSSNHSRYELHQGGHDADQSIINVGCSKMQCMHVWPNIQTGVNDTLSFYVNAAKSATHTYTFAQGNWSLAQMNTYVQTDNIDNGDYTNAVVTIVDNDTTTAPGYITIRINPDASGSYNITLIDTTLARQLGFDFSSAAPTDSVSSSTDDLTLTATKAYNLTYSMIHPSMVVVLDELEQPSGVGYNGTVSSTSAADLFKQAKVWFTLPMAEASMNSLIEYSPVHGENDLQKVQENPRSLNFRFYWEDLTPVDLGNTVVTLEFFVIKHTNK